MIMHIKKSDLIKIIIALEVGAIISTLHTYILNVFFMDVFSANMLLYIKAIINVIPHFSRLSTTSYLILSFSFLFECLVWAIVTHCIIKTVKKVKDDIPLYGTAEWATNGLLKGFGFIVKPKRSAVVCGQSDDAVFISRLPNRKEKEQIKQKYNVELENPNITESEREEILNRLQDENETMSTHQKSIGSYLVGTSEFNNTLTIGGVGSCKSQGTIIPTLLTWRESVVVNDPKGELFKATAGYRSTFSDVYYINPLDLCSTFRLNFLDWIPRDERAISTLQRFAKIAIPDNVGDSQPFFNNAARDVFLILLLDAIVYGEHQSVGEALSHLASDNSSSFKEYFDNMYLKTQDATAQINPGCESLLKDLKNNIGFFLKEAGQTSFIDVVSTMRSKLQIFTDPNIVSLSNDTTISPNQFQKTKRPISIYITTPTSDVDRCKDFIRLIFSSILIQLTSEQLTNNEIHNRVLFVLDEFFQLGTMDEVYKKIPIARGYGIQFMIAVQSVAQLYSLYGQKEAQSIFENMTIKDIKQVGEPETAAWVKSMLGRETIVKKRKSESKSKSNGSSNTSVSTQKEEVGHDLMDETQIMNMAYEEQLTIIKKIGKPYKSKKIHAFEDIRFRDKMNMPFKLNTVPCPLFIDAKTFDDKDDKKMPAKQKNQTDNKTAADKPKKTRKKTASDTEQKTLFDFVNEQIQNTDVLNAIENTYSANSQNHKSGDLEVSSQNKEIQEDTQKPQNHQIGGSDEKTTNLVVSENNEANNGDNQISENWERTKKWLEDKNKKEGAS